MFEDPKHVWPRCVSIQWHSVPFRVCAHTRKMAVTKKKLENKWKKDRYVQNWKRQQKCAIFAILVNGFFFLSSKEIRVYFSFICEIFALLRTFVIYHSYPLLYLLFLLYFSQWILLAMSCSRLLVNLLSRFAGKFFLTLSVLDISAKGRRYNGKENVSWRKIHWEKKRERRRKVNRLGVPDCVWGFLWLELGYGFVFL